MSKPQELLTTANVRRIIIAAAIRGAREGFRLIEVDRIARAKIAYQERLKANAILAAAREQVDGLQT
jgi:hypothetical protein